MTQLFGWFHGSEYPTNPSSLHQEMLKIQILVGSGMTIFKELETE
ncbi:MAG: hypothetical protein WCP63_01720 [Cyanobium sp. ELA712]